MLKESRTNEDFEYQRLTPEEQKARGILGRLTGICADFIHPTRNGRKYSETLWENVFNDPIMKEKIANRCCFGELGHPADRTETDMEKIAICLAEQPTKGKDGKLRAVFDILDTPNGRILKSLCDYGCNIGISSRGEGDLVTDYQGNESVDPDTYSCECWDAVLIPAVKEARLAYVTESLSKKRYNKTLRESLQKTMDNATADEKKIMTETLSSLNISLNEDKEKDRLYQVYLDAVKAYKETKAKFGKEAEETQKADKAVDIAWKAFKNSKDTDLEESVELDEMAAVRLLFQIKDADDKTIHCGKNIHEAMDDLIKDTTTKGLHLDVSRYEDQICTDTTTALIKCYTEDDINFYKGNSGTFLYIDGVLDKISYASRGKDVSNAINALNNGSAVVAYQPAVPSAKPPKFFGTIGKKNLDAAKTEDLDLNTNDIQDESLNINEEVKENLAVDNNEAIVEELQKTITANAELEKKLIELQEKLSVCYAKEAEQEELIVKNKETIKKLAESAKQANALQAKTSVLEEKYNDVKNNEVKLKEQLSEATKRAKDDSKINYLRENITKKAKQITTLDESVNKLTEALSKEKENTSKLTEALKQKDVENKKIVAENAKLKESAEKEKAALNESIAQLQKDLSLQKTGYAQKIEKSKQIVEKYKKATALAVDKYIELQAVRLGSSVKEVKNRLPESYSFEDIDKVCEGLQEYNLTMSKLPFAAAKKSMNENIKIAGTSSKNESILPVSGFDDDIDEDLMYLAGN